MNFFSKGMLLSLFALSSNALASIQTADFTNSAPWGPTNGIEERIYSTTLAGNDVWISGWSDTSNGSNDGAGDNTLRAQNMVQYGGGWGIINADESDNQPSHSVDNIASWDGSDAGTGRDYDFFLLDFDQQVTLESASFGWVNGSASQNQVTFIALNDSGNQSNSLTDLSGMKMSQLENMVMGGVGNGSGFGQVSWSNQTGYYANVGVEKSSSLWIVSAFNGRFGGSNSMAGNDGFKLSGITFSTSNGGGGGGNEVPEPATLTLMLLALATLSRKQLLKR